MTAILVATGPSDDADPLLRIGTSIANRTGGSFAWVMLDRTNAAGSDLQRLTGTDLLLVDPRYASRESASGLDPQIRDAIRSSEGSVLTVRDPAAWPPRNIVIFFDSIGLNRSALDRVGNWISAASLDEVDPDTMAVEMVYVSENPDALHNGLDKARDEGELLSARLGGRADVQLRACVRWGATPHKRILHWIERTHPDLAIVSSSPDTRGPEEWIHVLSDARCNVLLVPTASTPDAPEVSRVRSTRRTSRLNELATWLRNAMRPG